FIATQGRVGRVNIHVWSGPGVFQQFEPPMEETHFCLTQEPLRPRMPFSHTTCVPRRYPCCEYDRSAEETIGVNKLHRGAFATPIYRLLRTQHFHGVSSGNRHL